MSGFQFVPAVSFMLLQLITVGSCRALSLGNIEMCQERQERKTCNRREYTDKSVDTISFWCHF